MPIHRDRRRFTVALKLQIIEEAARCVAPGPLGALLRRKDLYSSHLSVWRTAAKREELTGPSMRSRMSVPAAVVRHRQ